MIKNNQDESIVCMRCKKKMGSGVRCSQCRSTWHWSFGGVKGEDKTDVISASKWLCEHCNGESKEKKNCKECRNKDKEIKNLKAVIAELEKTTQHLNQELKTAHESIADLQIHLKHEKKIRRKLEQEVIELQDGSSSPKSESERESEAETDRKESRRHLESNHNKTMSTKPLLEKRSSHGRSSKYKAENKRKKGNSVSPKSRTSYSRSSVTKKSSHLDKALDYLDKYQVDQEDNVDWPRHMSDTEDENRKERKTCTCKCEQSQKKAQVYAPYPSNKRQSSSKGKICFGFSRDGFCKYFEQCKFAHTGHSKPINNFSQYRPRSNNQNMQAGEKICFNFSKSGNCKYGDHCRYKHVTQQNTHESHHF